MKRLIRAVYVILILFAALLALDIGQTREWVRFGLLGIDQKVQIHLGGSYIFFFGILIMAALLAVWLTKLNKKDIFKRKRGFHN